MSGGRERGKEEGGLTRAGKQSGMRQKRAAKKRWFDDHDSTCVHATACCLLIVTALWYGLELVSHTQSSASAGGVTQKTAEPRDKGLVRECIQWLLRLKTTKEASCCLL